MRATSPFRIAYCLLICGLVALAFPAFGQGAGNGVARDRAPVERLVRPVPVGGLWMEFLFLESGSFGGACTECIPPASDNAVLGGRPPWKFTAPPAGARLTITDAFLFGDRFEVFDFGVSIGQTPAVAATGDCGEDPEICVVSSSASHATFNLSAGPHEITIQAIDSPFDLGAAYFRVDAFDHLVCYKVQSTRGFRHRKVQVKNLFGNQTFVVLEPDTLCVPSTEQLLPPP
jgi:hypothetical protein